MLVIFHNVTIEIESESPEKAYRILEDALEVIGELPGDKSGWASDTYSVDGEMQDGKAVDHLFGKA